MADVITARWLPPRRAALRAGLAAGLASVLVPALSACTSENRPSTVTVAGGEPGGFYLEFSTLLAESLQRHGVADNAVALTTGGSLDNLQHLLTGKATFAVALADSAARQSAAKNTSDGEIAALGKVYENYVHCVVRKNSGIRDVTGLAGRNVAVGGPGSGTSLTAARLIEAAGLSASPAGADTTDKTITVINLGLNDGLAALRGGSVDALFWSGGVPTAAITATNKEVGLGFLDLSTLIPAARTRYGAFYDRVLIPEGSYEGIPAVWTVGVANLLLCRNDLDASTVRRTVELLVGHAQELIPRSSLGVQFLSPESLINTAGLPLHPAAAAAYRASHG
ncbi:C4-dicarboxylate ABC transporter substrate-binding protein [Arthrobacter sp. Leaf337]|uniref:TAXI family TRAP transporter solute-binding subunit n=1 Tax=Arthrobacter sp. Leaf337 TaxID=1736342 RepID=UPI00070082CC|nr:TAXI family TRAP transporter solute-binding subunit [Arthrobacter sp. Leaf337]KQR64153.1 C4-dicarboxylate ABC transporter substrate-binding protein [Arthrobacter sp. Leaf337]